MSRSIAKSPLSVNALLVLSVVSFIVLMITQFISGFLIFISRYGWTYRDLDKFYLGPDGTPFSVAHHLEVAVPHSLAMGLAIFVLTHFFLFTSQHHKRKIFVLWSLMLANCFCGVIVAVLGKQLLFLKIITFFGFQLCFSIVVWSLFKELINRKPT